MIARNEPILDTTSRIKFVAIVVDHPTKHEPEPHTNRKPDWWKPKRRNRRRQRKEAR